MKMFRVSLLAVVALVIMPAWSFAVALVGPGNLVIFRAGDGAAALSGSATSSFLDEYTPAGAFVQTIALPTTGTSALTVIGNATTEGVISRSQDGTSLVFAGYRSNAGTASGVTASNKVIGSLASTSVTPSTSIAVTDFGTVSTRSATTVNGSAYYLSGATSGSAGGVRYVGAPSGSSTSASIDVRNSRQVNLSGNTLFASNGSTAITGKVQTYGTLPTGATTATPIVSLTTADAVHGFFLADISNTVAGADTLYALSTVANQLLKYTFNGTTWSASGTLALGSTAASGAANLVGMVGGVANVTLFLTSGTTLSKITDASGFGGTLAGTFTSLATAGTNTAFRGINTFAAAAVPEAGSFILGGLVTCVLGIAAIWRRTSAKSNNS